MRHGDRSPRARAGAHLCLHRRCARVAQHERCHVTAPGHHTPACSSARGHMRAGATVPTHVYSAGCSPSSDASRIDVPHPASWRQRCGGPGSRCGPSLPAAGRAAHLKSTTSFSADTGTSRPAADSVRHTGGTAKPLTAGAAKRSDTGTYTGPGAGGPGTVTARRRSRLRAGHALAAQRGAPDRRVKATPAQQQCAHAGSPGTQGANCTARVDEPYPGTIPRAGTSVKPATLMPGCPAEGVPPTLPVSCGASGSPQPATPGAPSLTSALAARGPSTCGGVPGGVAAISPWECHTWLLSCNPSLGERTAAWHPLQAAAAHPLPQGPAGGAPGCRTLRPARPRL